MFQHLIHIDINDFLLGILLTTRGVIYSFFIKKSEFTLITIPGNTKFRDPSKRKYKITHKCVKNSDHILALSVRNLM